MTRVAMGGTFDVIHRGHEALLETALEVESEGVFIGVTTDGFANAHRDRKVEPYDDRVARLEAYLEERGWRDRVEVGPIEDPYGRALEEDFDTLVATQETRRGVELINTKRAEEGLDPLAVVYAPLILAEDGERLSSTRVRGGEVNAEGQVLRTLRVAVGSANPVKVEAVDRILQRIREHGATVEGMKVASGVPEQPRGHEETVEGALQRAQRALEALEDADWGVGIEAGLLELPPWDEALDVQVVAIVDRAGQVSLGHGPGFQHPHHVMEAVDAGATVGEAFDTLEGTEDVGRRQGAIGVLTHDAMDRRELTEAGVLMAAVPRMNPSAYELPLVEDAPEAPPEG